MHYQNAIIATLLALVVLASACSYPQASAGRVDASLLEQETPRHEGLQDPSVSQGDAAEKPERQVGLKNGNIAPDFTLTTTDNAELTLSTLGKPAVVYFFAIWCPFCAEDFRSLSKIYPAYDKEVAFIATSLDLKEDAEEIRKYKSTYNGLEEAMFAPGKESVLRDYSITHTTTKYAVARDGSIIYSGSGPLTEQQWTTLLDALKKS